MTTARTTPPGAPLAPVDSATRPTVALPRPDPVPALAARLVRLAADRAACARDEAALTPPEAARLRRLILGTGCATPGCGRRRMELDGLCWDCALASADGDAGARGLPPLHTTPASRSADATTDNDSHEPETSR